MPPVADYPSVNSHGTPRRSHAKHDQLISSQRLKVELQKVDIEVDLAENVIIGETEITVIPLESTLKQIKLDCRGTQVESITVNGKSATFSFTDFFQNDEYLNEPENPVLENYEYNSRYDTHSLTSSIEQHHLYRGKFYPLYTDQNDTQNPLQNQNENTNELTIKIPDSIKIKLHDGNLRQTQSPMTNRIHTTTPMATNTFMNSERVYTPLTVHIKYKVVNAKNGITFYGGNHTTIPKNRWMCYTNNSDIGCSASSWVPCIDNLYEKAAWDIRITYPETVGDIGKTAIVGTEEGYRTYRRKNQLILQDEEEDEEEENDATAGNDNSSGNKNNNNIYHDNEDDEIDESTPLIVAVPDLVSFKEERHKIDFAKKIISFQFYNPICPHHLGFAVGAFERMPFLETKPGTKELVVGTNDFSILDEVNLDPNMLTESSNANKVPTMLYFFPDKKNDVLNTTAFMYKALDFFSKEFGSFPFNSYSMVFLNDMPCESLGFAGMSLVSDDLLYSPDIIEPIFDNTEKLSIILANQYSGINVLPKTFNDLWCVIGLAHFMASQFLKKLFGLNHYKFKIKQNSDLLCELDVGRRPLANQFFRFPLNIEQDCNFVSLKSSLVLFILDRRMTKTDKSFGLSRVIPKIFLQAMSNDLFNGNCLSTHHFQHVCEKVAHHKLESFFQNWVYGSGTPILRVTQKFSKKRMFIEMTINQVQANESSNDDKQDSGRDTQYQENIRRKYQRENFLDEASMSLSLGENVFKTQNVFTGPMTIRIHEADGTPYEHIVDIQEGNTKLDIPYNTKYRRIKRPVKKDDESGGDDFGVNRLGDVLSTSKEIEAWNLSVEDNSSDESGLANTNSSAASDAFEWIRVDADFEWICKVYINQDDNMFESQLCQDRDVEAQMESIKYFSESLRPSAYYATILLRTVIDERYFFGLRVEAVKGLARISKDETDHIGLKYLLKAYKFLYCYSKRITKNYKVLDPNEYLPLPNDFSNFASTFVLNAFPGALSLIKDKDGKPLTVVKQILLNMFKYNDNTSNDFSDYFYQANLIKALALIISRSGAYIENHNYCITNDDDEDSRNGQFGGTSLSKDELFLKETIIEFNRSIKLEQWLPSYHCKITETVLREKINLAIQGSITMTFEELLLFTSPTYHSNVRIAAFEGLLVLGGLKNKSILELFFMMAKLDPSPLVKSKLIKAFARAIGVAAVDGTISYLDDEEFLTEDAPPNDNAKKESNTIVSSTIIVDEMGSSGNMGSRRDQMARSTIKGAIEVLRRDYGRGKGLRKELWEGLHSSLLTINCKRDLFDIVTLLYRALNTFVVSMKSPMEKKLVPRVDKIEVPSETCSGSIVISIKQEGRLKIQLPTLKTKITIPKTDETLIKPILKIKQATKEIAPRTPTIVKKEPVFNLSLSPIATTSSAPSLPALTSTSAVKPTITKTFEVKFKYKKPIKNSVTISEPMVDNSVLTSAIEAYPKRRVQYEIIRSSPEAPLRYVKLDIIQKKVIVSSETFEPPVEAPNSLPVTLKISPRKLLSLSSRKRKDESEEPEKKSKKPKTVLLLRNTSVKEEPSDDSRSQSALPKIKLKFK